MRLTIGKKLNGLIVLLLILGIGGIVILATQLFTGDLSGLLKKGTLDTSSMLSSRIRSDMKSIAERVRMLGAASLEDFKYSADRIKFIQDNLSVDSQYVSLSLYSVSSQYDPKKMKRQEKKGGSKKSDQKDKYNRFFGARWRVLNPDIASQKKIKTKDFSEMDKKYPLDFDWVARGNVDFTVGKLKSLPVIRMAIPFVQRKKNFFSQFLVVELDQRRLTSLFSESTAYTSYLLERSGRVLGSTDLNQIPLGKDMGSLQIVEVALKKSAQGGQLDFEDERGEKQMGAYQKIGFAGLIVVTQVPFARAASAQKQLYRRTALMGGMFLFLALTVGFLFSQSLVGPILALNTAAKKVREGDFSIRLKSGKARKKKIKKKKEKPSPAPDSSVQSVDAQEPLNETGVDSVSKEEEEFETVYDGDEIQQFAATFNEMVKGLEEREKVKETFSKFTSKELAEKILQGELKLGGERKHACIFFSDVRGFTAMSEKLEPEELVGILNRYMTRMVSIVLTRGGVVDKFIGDAIMAVWGAPITKPNDAKQAIMACIDMRKALVELNNEFKAEGLPIIKIGMGLNYGPLIAGNIGSTERMEYTVIGDSVNTASRIESLTKAFGTDLLVSKDLLDQTGDTFIAEKCHEAMVKGKSEPLVIYKVHGYRENGQEVRVVTEFSEYPAEKSDKVVSTGPSDAPPPAAVPPPSSQPTPPQPDQAYAGPDPTVVNIQLPDSLKAKPSGSFKEVQGFLSPETQMVSLLTRDLNFHDFMMGVLDVVGVQIPSKTGLFLELGPDSKSLFLRSLVGEGRRGITQFRYSLNKSILATIVHNKKILVLSNKSRSLPYLQKELGIPLKNVIAIPLSVRDKFFGVFALVDRVGADAFTTEDVEVLGSLSDSASRVLEIRLLMKHAERLREQKLARTFHDSGTSLLRYAG